MRTDMIVEEEFELKEEEPWFDKQDLEHDLQLAAELGKNLLDRNRELEQGLQQMYSTNQEQLQEIEYLTKQVELLRQVNDQHAKVYEQLDMSARELEQSNHKLSLDNRTAQQKIRGLMETVELLQSQVDELQHEVEQMKRSSPQKERATPQGARSVSCLKELQDALSYSDSEEGPLEEPEASWQEEAQTALRHSLQNLQMQFASERARRDQAEREVALLSRENETLEQQLAGMERCQARVSELEREVEDLHHAWKSESSPRCGRTLNMSATALLQTEEGADEVKPSWVLTHSGSQRLLKATDSLDSPDRVLDHECLCARRAEVVKYRGISLLNEVDAQYSALQVKYDELLRRCSQDDELDGCQTLSCPDRTHKSDLEDDFHQPEYKELFREIFSRIQKTKEDLIHNRGRPVP
ncbi:cerebellar degeneration-related protein 2-like [Synchiropus picturatus]